MFSRRCISAPVVNISPHQFGSDGITTHVRLHGCSLRCHNCVNPQCTGKSKNCETFTPDQLLELVFADDVYFRSTYGGLTFCGCEPALHRDFIAEFRRICPADWKIRLFTHLQIPAENIARLSAIVDEWIVDLKTGESESYRRFTQCDYGRVLENLRLLTCELNVPQSFIRLRIPVIAGFTTKTTVRLVEQRFSGQGFNRIETYQYGEECETFGNNRSEDLLATVRREIACAYRLTPGSDASVAKLSSCLADEPGFIFGVSDETIARIANISREPDSEPPALACEPPATYHRVTKPTPPQEKIVFQQFAVAGVSYHIEIDDQLWDELEAGQRVALVREYTNKYDPNAVAIALADHFNGDVENFDFNDILGYVPRTENLRIAQLIDMGWGDALEGRLTAVDRIGPLQDRLRLTVYLLHR